MTESALTVVAVSLSGGQVGTGWSRAHVVAVAHVQDGEVTEWTEHVVGWDVLHDQAPSGGSHHARIVRFCRDQAVQVVATGHLGPPMHHTLTRLGCKVVTGLTGDARDAVVRAVDAPASPVALGGQHGPTTIRLRQPDA